MEASGRSGAEELEVGGKRLFKTLLKKVGLVLLIGLLFIYILTSPWFLRKLYPFPYRDLVLENCAAYQVEQYLVLAIIKTESRFHTNAESPVGARGLMQIMPETGKWIAAQMNILDFRTDNLYNPSYNIPMGIWYLSYLKRTFDGNIVQVIAAYNAGEHKIKRWMNEGIWTGQLDSIDNIPYKETRDYVNRVLFNYQIYKKIYQS
jgi:soluble lytic murein transglycosylase